MSEGFIKYNELAIVHNGWLYKLENTYFEFNIPPIFTLRIYKPHKDAVDMLRVCMDDEKWKILMADFTFDVINKDYCNMARIINYGEYIQVTHTDKLKKEPSKMKTKDEYIVIIPNIGIYKLNKKNNFEYEVKLK